MEKATEEDKGLSFYWELASTNEPTRLEAAKELVEYLSVAQQTHVQEDINSETDLCPELKYSLKRLTKGLASSRKGARQGFAMVLAEILHHFDIIAPEDVIKMLADNLQVTGSAKSQEERDGFIGHIFGLMALVRARSLDVVKDVEVCSWLKQVVETLKQLTEKKSYLRELGIKSIADIISMASFEVYSQYVEPTISDYVYEGWETATPSSLLIALTVEKHFKGQMDRKKFKKIWSHLPLLDGANITQLAEVLQESSLVHPKVHCIWDEVLSQACHKSTEEFKKFWKAVVDDGLFQSTHERKYLGFQLIEKILPMLKSEQVAAVFAKNSMRSFINNLSSAQTYLHKAARHLASSMPTLLKGNDDPETSAEVVIHLLGSYGNLSFDKLTKTKTVESLFGVLKGPGLVKLVSWLTSSFIQGSITYLASERSSGGDVDPTRISILNQLLLLVKAKKLSESGAWIENIMKFLIDQSYFTAVRGSKKLQVPLSAQVRQTCEQRFLSTMKELDSPSPASHGQAKTSGRDEEVHVMFTIVKHAQGLLADDDFTVIAESWSEISQKSFDSAMKIISKIHKKQSKESTASTEDRAFELLLCHITLQLFSDPDQASEILKEVRACHKNRQETDTSRDEPHWVEVLTEILLSLLTRPSGLLRHVVDRVFVAIAPHLTKDAMGIVLQAIDPKSLGGEDDEVLEIAEDSDDEDMAADDGDEDNDKKPCKETKEDESDSEDESDDDDDEGDDDAVDEAFRAEIKAALGSAAADTDSEESSGEELDDEAMMQLDDALSAVFKTRVQANKEKKDKKDTAKTILHFKLRVLDMIEIFIKKQSHNPLVLDLVEPLLSLAWSTLGTKDYQTLGERAQAIYRNKLCSIREHPSVDQLNSEDLHDRIGILVQKAMKAPSLNIVSLIARGCMLIIRVLRGSVEKPAEVPPKKRKKKEEVRPCNDHGGQLDVPRVAKVFEEALKDFMEKRSTHLHPVLFTELINRFPFVAWELAPQLIRSLQSAVNNFRKTQACAMLTQLLSHKCPSYDKHLETNAQVFQDTLAAIISGSATAETQMKAKHFREVLKLTTKLIKETSGELLDHKRLKDALQTALSGPLATRSNDIKSTCVRLVSTLSGTKETPKKKEKKTQKKEKQTNGKTNEQIEANEPRKKKKKNK
ncbi:myb-binding protein 1A-like protein isoform X2 [Nematostella vectensis]|uniref:myb-binding protein 1A-like protein isoform X2 n=1 Tax=Nematostella vectensis TaxID=45351 RepID=UPI002076E6DB|nr:myb-binding protein 1A-like protein isoform X2 [Nematostella vectensis]